MKKILASLSAMFLGAVSMDSITAMNNPAVSETEVQNFEAQKTAFQQAYNLCNFYEMISTINRVKTLDQASELFEIAKGLNVLYLEYFFENITGLKIVDAINIIPHEKFVQNYPGLLPNAASHSKTVDDLFKDQKESMFFFRSARKNYDHIGECPYFFNVFQSYTKLDKIPCLSKVVADEIKKDYFSMNDDDKRFVFYLAIKHRDLDLATYILLSESKSENIGEKYADLFNLVSGLITPRWLLSPDHLEALRIEEARRREAQRIEEARRREAQKFLMLKSEFIQAMPTNNQAWDLSKMRDIIGQVENSNHILELVKLAEGINVVHLMWCLERKTGLKIVDAINSVKNRCDKYSHLELGIKNFNENGGRFNLKDIIMIEDLFKDWGNSSYFGSNESYQDLTKSNYCFLNDSEAAKVEEDYSTMDKNDKRFAFFLAVKFGHLDLAAKVLQIESQSGNVGEKYADLFNLVSRLITPYWLIRNNNWRSDIVVKDDYFALSCVSYGNAFRDVLNYCTEKVDLFKNESSSVKDVLVRCIHRVYDQNAEKILKWAKERRSYMDDSQLAIVASVNISRYRAEQAMPALLDFFTWLIENKGRERAVNIIGQSFIVSTNDQAGIRAKLINQLFNDEEKFVMLNTALSKILPYGQSSSPFCRIPITDQRANQLINGIVSEYEKDKNMQKLEKLFQKLIEYFRCYKDTCITLSRIFLKRGWSPEQSETIKQWKCSPFHHMDE